MRRGRLEVTISHHFGSLPCSEGGSSGRKSSPKAVGPGWSTVLRTTASAQLTCSIITNDSGTRAGTPS